MDQRSPSESEQTSECVFVRLCILDTCISLRVEDYTGRDKPDILDSQVSDLLLLADCRVDLSEKYNRNQSHKINATIE